MSGEKLRIVQLGKPGDEILTEDLTTIESNPKLIAQYFSEMSRLCRDHSGIGLAANQVGLRENFFFAARQSKILPTGGLLLINPTWTPHRDGYKYVAKGEGCLSLPNPNMIGTRRFDVERWSKIVASWYDSAGNKVKPRTLSGIAAQVFQHEHDHLRGILLTTTGTEINLL